MILKNLNYKEISILVLFSLSIFLSHVSILKIELRFVYLLVVFILFYELFKKRKINFNFFINLSFLIVIIFFHSYINQVSLINNLSYPFDDYQPNKTELLKKLIYKCLVIFISATIIYHYKKLLINNFYFICNFYILSIFTLIIFSKYNELSIFFDTNSIMNCSYGYFFTKKIFYTETSHFNLISVPIILFFVYKHKEYLRSKIIYVLNILFLIFSFLNFSLTFYLALNLSIISIVIFLKNLKKENYMFFITLVILSNAIFFYEGKSEFCQLNETKISSKYNFPKNKELILGGKLSSKAKLFEQGLNSPNYINMSLSIYLYSLNLSYENLIKHPLGSGLSNYELVFKDNVSKNMSPRTEKTLLNPQGLGLSLNKEKFPRLFPHILSFNSKDGSVNLSKLTVEYGIIFIFFSVVFIILFLKLRGNNELKLISICFLIPQIFVRSSGFFFNGFLIILILLIIHLISKDND